MIQSSDYGIDWVTTTVGSVGPHIITKTVAASGNGQGAPTYRVEGPDRGQINLSGLLMGMGYTRAAAITLANQMDPQSKRFGGGGE